VNCARSDLCGGRPETDVPTAFAEIRNTVTLWCPGARRGSQGFPLEPFHRMERRMESELAAESHPAKLSTSLLAFSFAITLTILPFPVLGRPVNTIAEAAVENTLTPGVAVAILHHGSIVYEAGFGTAGPNNARVTPATRFAIGSLTKQFTAVAALQLVRQGKLSLDDRLKKFLPKLPNASSITIRELLNQTSGLHNYPNPQHEWPKSGPVQSSRLIAYFAKDLSDFTPGTKWAYSNTNYAVLADIVARVSGKPYRSVLSDTNFNPLGMTASGYGFGSQRPSDATPAKTDSTAWTPDNERVTLDVAYGAGGIISTAHDMAKWDAALLGSFIDDATRRLLWAPESCRTARTRPTGWALASTGCTAIATCGTTATFRAPAVSVTTICSRVMDSQLLS